MMFQLVLAYLFAAAMGVTIVYMARQNRKQGWQRPTPKWFGVELEAREAAIPSAPVTESDAGDLLPELLLLNRELAAHGTPIRPRVQSPEVESAESPNLVSVRRS